MWIFGIGGSDFREFRECFLYIDMTELIFHILTSGEKVISFNFPRRFGKSLNLSMLRCFLSMKFENDGTLLETNNNKNKILFAGGEIIKKPDVTKKILSETKVWKNHPELHSKFGMYPVIYLDLKDTKPCIKYEQFLENLKAQLAI